jgi:hypothetical protein
MFTTSTNTDPNTRIIELPMRIAQYSLTGSRENKMNRKGIILAGGKLGGHNKKHQTLISGRI